MTLPDGNVRQFVLRTSVVRAALDQLKDRRIHSYLPAYLLIRSRLLETGRTSLGPGQVQWARLNQFLELPGGPPSKPCYRPMWPEDVKDPGVYWISNHHVGKYGPASIRASSTATKVVQVGDNQGLALVPNHAPMALEFFLYGDRLDVVSLCTFLYRDFALRSRGDPPAIDDLVEVFRRDFHFVDHGEQEMDFDTLFDVASTKLPADGIDWFLELTL